MLTWKTLLLFTLISGLTEGSGNWTIRHRIKSNYNKYPVKKVSNDPLIYSMEMPSKMATTDLSKSLNEPLMKQHKRQRRGLPSMETSEISVPKMVRQKRCRAVERYLQMKRNEAKEKLFKSKEHNPMALESRILEDSKKHDLNKEQYDSDLDQGSSEYSSPYTNNLLSSAETLGFHDEEKRSTEQAEGPPGKTKNHVTPRALSQLVSQDAPFTTATEKNNQDVSYYGYYPRASPETPLSDKPPLKEYHALKQYLHLVHEQQRQVNDHLQKRLKELSPVMPVLKPWLTNQHNDESEPKYTGYTEDVNSHPLHEKPLWDASGSHFQNAEQGHNLHEDHESYGNNPKWHYSYGAQTPYILPEMEQTVPENVLQTLPKENGAIESEYLKSVKELYEKYPAALTGNVGMVAQTPNVEPMPHSNVSPSHHPIAEEKGKLNTQIHGKLHDTQPYSLPNQQQSHRSGYNSEPISSIVSPSHHPISGKKEDLNTPIQEKLHDTQPYSLSNQQQSHGSAYKKLSEGTDTHTHIPISSQQHQDTETHLQNIVTVRNPSDQMEPSGVFQNPHTLQTLAVSSLSQDQNSNPHTQMEPSGLFQSPHILQTSPHSSISQDQNSNSHTQVEPSGLFQNPNILQTSPHSSISQDQNSNPYTQMEPLGLFENPHSVLTLATQNLEEPPSNKKNNSHPASPHQIYSEALTHHNHDLNLVPTVQQVYQQSKPMKLNVKEQETTHKSSLITHPLLEPKDKTVQSVLPEHLNIKQHDPETNPVLPNESPKLSNKKDPELLDPSHQEQPPKGKKNHEEIVQEPKESIGEEKNMYINLQPSHESRHEEIQSENEKKEVKLHHKPLESKQEAVKPYFDSQDQSPMTSPKLKSNPPIQVNTLIDEKTTTPKNITHVTKTIKNTAIAEKIGFTKGNTNVVEDQLKNEPTLAEVLRTHTHIPSNPLTHHNVENYSELQGTGTLHNINSHPTDKEMKQITEETEQEIIHLQKLLDVMNENEHTPHEERFRNAPINSKASILKEIEPIEKEKVLQQKFNEKRINQQEDEQMGQKGTTVNLVEDKEKMSGDYPIRYLKEHIKGEGKGPYQVIVEGPTRNKTHQYEMITEMPQYKVLKLIENHTTEPSITELLGEIKALTDIINYNKSQVALKKETLHKEQGQSAITSTQPPPIDEPKIEQKALTLELKNKIKNKNNQTNERNNPISVEPLDHPIISGAMENVTKAPITAEDSIKANDDVSHHSKDHLKVRNMQSLLHKIPSSSSITHGDIIIPFDENSSQKRIILVDPNHWRDKPIHVLELPQGSQQDMDVSKAKENQSLRENTNEPEDPFYDDQLARSAPDTMSNEDYEGNSENDEEGDDSYQDQLPEQKSEHEPWDIYSYLSFLNKGKPNALKESINQRKGTEIPKISEIEIAKTPKGYLRAFRNRENNAENNQGIKEIINEKSIKPIDIKHKQPLLEVNAGPSSSKDERHKHFSAMKKPHDSYEPREVIHIKFAPVGNHPKFQKQDTSGFVANPSSPTTANKPDLMMMLQEKKRERAETITKKIKESKQYIEKLLKTKIPAAKTTFLEENKPDTHQPNQSNATQKEPLPPNASTNTVGYVQKSDHQTHHTATQASKQLPSIEKQPTPEQWPTRHVTQIRDQNGNPGQFQAPLLGNQGSPSENMYSQSESAVNQPVPEQWQDSTAKIFPLGSFHIQNPHDLPTDATDPAAFAFNPKIQVQPILENDKQLHEPQLQHSMTHQTHLQNIPNTDTNHISELPTDGSKLQAMNNSAPYVQTDFMDLTEKRSCSCGESHRINAVPTPQINYQSQDLGSSENIKATQSSKSINEPSTYHNNNEYPDIGDLMANIKSQRERLEHGRNKMTNNEVDMFMKPKPSESSEYIQAAHGSKSIKEPCTLHNENPELGDLMANIKSQRERLAHGRNKITNNKDDTFMKQKPSGIIGGFDDGVNSLDGYEEEDSVQLKPTCGCQKSSDKPHYSSRQKTEGKEENLKASGHTCACNRESECHHNEIVRLPASSDHEDPNKYDILHNMLLYLKRYSPVNHILP